jgi:hypothetical protein
MPAFTKSVCYCFPILSKIITFRQSAVNPLRINNFLKIRSARWPSSKLLQSGRANYVLFIDSWAATCRQTKRMTKGSSQVEFSDSFFNMKMFFRKQIKDVPSHTALRDVTRSAGAIEPHYVITTWRYLDAIDKAFYFLFLPIWIPH